MHGVGLQVHSYRRAGTAALPKIRNLSPSYEKCTRQKVSRELRREVLQKSHYKCYCCEKKNAELEKRQGDYERLQMHHIVPVNLGGKTELENLLPLCCNCHRSVHRLIDRMHINPAKFKRTVLEDAVLQIAELRAQERARQFGSMGLQEEGIMGGGQGQISPEEKEKYWLMLFVLSMSMGKKKFRMLRREMQQGSKESTGQAACFSPLLKPLPFASPP